MSRDNHPYYEVRYILAGVILTACVYLAFVSAVALEQSVSRFGYVADPDGTRRFLRELAEPNFEQAGADAIKQAKGVDTFLYRAVYKAHAARYGKPFVVGSQGIGDCISWGFGHGCYFAACINWQTGKAIEAPLMPATESIYGGSRVEGRGRPEGSGGWSDGSYGGAAARWLSEVGGIVYREPVGGHDLTTYSADRAKQWGCYGNGGAGDRGALDAIAKKHPCSRVALVTDFDSAAAAIESGYPVAVASGVGFESTRDADGFAKRGVHPWGHCMCFVSSRHADGEGKRDGLLCLNSWGPKWIGGPKWPSDQPDGSFWVDRRTVDAMLAGEDSFAVSSESFVYRDLNHHDWLGVSP